METAPVIHRQECIWRRKSKPKACAWARVDTLLQKLDVASRRTVIQEFNDAAGSTYEVDEDGRAPSALHMTHLTADKC